MPSTEVLPAQRDNPLARLADPVAEALALTEDYLEHLMPSSIGAPVQSFYQQMLKAGGKRLRPLLTLLSCQAAGRDARCAVKLAAAVEVLHLASLIHDDVIDEASERRGRPSARQTWGNRASILLGDFLVAEVFRRMTDELGQQSLGILAGTVGEMCRAELAEQPQDPSEASEEQYFLNIRGKTASLMAASCEIGAIAAGNGPAQSLLRDYGLALGQAFQIMDDLLDLYGDPDNLGKPVLQDLARSQWTLPIIHALQVAPEPQVAKLHALLLEAPHNPEAAPQAADLAEALGGRSHALAAANGLLDVARATLDGLADTPARASLRALTDYVVERSH